MKASEFVEILAPFKGIVNRSALSPTFRALELTHTKIIGRAAFAHIERSLKPRYQLPLDESVFIDAATLLGVVDSLPPDGELKLTVTENTLDWECGKAAKGRLARMEITDAIYIDSRASIKNWSPTKEFKEALRLGGLSCGEESFGLYGVVIDNRGELLTICSSDDTTISIATVANAPDLTAPDLMTLRPESAALLCDVIDPDKRGQIEFDSEYIHYSDADLLCRVTMTNKPLGQDLEKVYSKFTKGKTRTTIAAERIMAFTQRAAVMAENKQNTIVGVGATKERLTLSFMEGVVASDEYLILDELNLDIALPDIYVDALRLARGLTPTNEVILDYLKRRIVVFRRVIKGKTPDKDTADFIYMVSGQKQDEDE